MEPPASPPTSPPPTSILLVKNQPLVGVGLRALLEKQAGMQIVGEADNWARRCEAGPAAGHSETTLDEIVQWVAEDDDRQGFLLINREVMGTCYSTVTSPARGEQ
jgi:hypothetical protein